MKRLLQYDIAHGRFPRVEKILEQVSLLKKFGLTGVLLYLDGEGAQTSFPAKGSIPAEYLRMLRHGLDMLELDFIPHIQTLGHMEQMLARTEMRSWRDDPEGGRTLRIDLPEVREGMKRYITEVTALFHSEYVHCGGDEASTLGLGLSRQNLQFAGLENTLADYWNDINRFLRSLHKKMVIYGDQLIVFPALRDKLDKDIVIANWGYCATDEVFEAENHHYSSHFRICKGHPCWITGNAMAEYIFLPFQRLRDNMEILLKLGMQSGAEAFVISDWGSYSNINPMLNTTLGAIYCLRRIQDPTYDETLFSKEISYLILGKERPEFSRAFHLLLDAQSNSYWTEKLLRRGAVLPCFLGTDPSARSTITSAAVMDKKQLSCLFHDMEEVCRMLEVIDPGICVRPEWLEDLRGIARRVKMTVFRAQLCYDYAWYAGAVWISACEKKAMLERLKLYQDLAKEDCRWYEKVWTRDCVDTGLPEAIAYLKQAADSARKTVICPENTLLYFTPEPESE